MKKEKKKGSCLKTVLIAFGVLIVLGAIGSAFGDDEKTNSDNSQNIEQAKDKSSSADEISQSEDSDKFEQKGPSEVAPDASDETEPEDDEPLGFNVSFSNTYRNDATGN